MSAVLNHFSVQFKMDLRERGTLMVFYMIPLIFYIVMGAVFSSINVQTKETLSASMIIFSTSMGAVLGMPGPLIKMRESGVLRAYRVNGIPNAAVLVVEALSAFLHLLVVSLIIVFSAPLLFGAAQPKNFGMFFLVLICLLVTNIMIGLLIGVTAHSQSSATMLSQAVFMPSLLLSGIMFPASMLPKLLIWLGRIFPATHSMQAFTGLAFRLDTQFDPALALAVCAGIGVLVGIAAFLRSAAMTRALS